PPNASAASPTPTTGRPSFALARSTKRELGRKDRQERLEQVFGEDPDAAHAAQLGQSQVGLRAEPVADDHGDAVAPRPAQELGELGRDWRWPAALQQAQLPTLLMWRVQVVGELERALEVIEARSGHVAWHPHRSSIGRLANLMPPEQGRPEVILAGWRPTW